MMQPSTRLLAAALALHVTLMTGCSNAIDPQAAAEAEKAYQAVQSKQTKTGRRINPTQLALLRAADAQYGLMAEALAIFSDDGTKPLFDRSIDPGIKDTKKGLANYRRLIVALDRLAAAEPGFREAMKKISAETGIEWPGKPHPCQLLPGGSMRLFALWPPAQLCLMQTDSALAGWDFWNIPARRRATDRETIRQLTLVDSAKLDRQSRKRLVDRVYQQAKEVAKVNINSDADKTRLKSLMSSQKDFYANLLDGKLDELAPHLHRQMCEDAESSGQDYLKLADGRGETPGKILVRTGADAVNSGVNVYVAVAKDALGTQLGEELGTGLDAAKTTWEKIEQAEKGLPELKKNVAKDAKEAIRKRAVEYLSEKLGVPADALDKTTEDVGESVEDFAQNVEFDRRVAEAGKAGFQDLIEHDLKEGVRSFDAIRQATDEVSAQTQKEGWGRGTVQVGSPQDGRPLDGAVLWYEDGRSHSPKLLVHPLPVVPGEKLSLPDGAKVELVEMSDSGEIRRVTDGPILVSADGVAMIGLQKSEKAPPPNAVADDTAKPTPPEPAPGNPEDGRLGHGKTKDAAQPARAEDAKRFCFTESNIPAGWKLSRIRDSLKQFVPFYEPEYERVRQNFRLYPADLVEQVHQDGTSARNYYADGTMVPSERNRWLGVHVVLMPSVQVNAKTGYRWVWKDALPKQIKDANEQGAMRLIREIREAGIEVGYLMQERLRGEWFRHYEIRFVKGDWYVEISTWGHPNFMAEDREATLPIARDLARRIPGN